MQGQLGGVTGAAEDREADALAGIAEVDAAIERGDARMEAIAVEKADLRTRHDLKIGEMQAWIGDHRGQRVAGMGDLDAIVKRAP
jgi:hypothetical protein